MKTDYQNDVEQILSRWTRGLCPGGQVLIKRGSETLYDSCFGYGNLEHKIPVTSNSIFHIASVSKQFTVLAILLLQEDGKLNIDDDIHRYLKNMISFSEPVTIRQMMNNVSGIRDQWELLFLRGIKITDSISMEDVNTSIMLQKTLNFEPQSNYLYSNTGFHLLAVIVECLSGMTFPEFVRKRIFLPLGMSNTFIRSSFSEVRPNMVSSYQDDGTQTYYYCPLNYELYGPTSVNTCAHDLMKILDEYQSPSVFSKEIIQTILRAAVLRDGTEIEYCGGMMTHLFHGLKVYEHGGADAAFRSHVLWIPEKELKIVLLSNTNTYLSAKAVKALACMVLGISEDQSYTSIDSTMIEEPSNPLKSGIYSSLAPDDPFLMTIVQKNTLFYMQREFALTPLFPQKNGSFRIGDLDEYLFVYPTHLEYLLPSRKQLLWPVSECSATAAAAFPLICGDYMQEETACKLTLKQDACGLTVYHPRYGKARLFLTHDHLGIFGFSTDFCMYVQPGLNAETIILNGSRARNMECHLIV